MTNSCESLRLAQTKHRKGLPGHVWLRWAGKLPESGRVESGRGDCAW